MGKVNGIVLAAGYGTRLQPLTDYIPKPMLPICNHPLLENIILKMFDNGVEKLAINTHHIPEKIEKFVSESAFSEKVMLFHEPKILGIGGAIVNCGRILADGDFFVLHNGDVLSDINISELIRYHLKYNPIITMVLTNGTANKVLVSRDNNIIDIGDKLKPANSGGLKKFTYTGIAVFSHEIFNYLPKKPCFCSIIDAILTTISENPCSVKAYIPEKVYWNDIGTFFQYFKVHEDVLISKSISLPNTLNTKKTYIKGKRSLVPKSAKLEGFVTIGSNCRIGSNAKIRNCIILDGAVIKDFDFRSYELIGKDFSVHRDIEILKNLRVFRNTALKDVQIGTIAEQGSNRRFYRLTKRGKHSVMMLSSSTDQDFERFIKIGTFLHKVKLGVPEIYEYDDHEYTVLMEDLGNDTIFMLMNEKKNMDIFSGKRRLIKNDKHFDHKTYYYKKIIEWLVKFQTQTMLHDKECKSTINRSFDFEGLRWETGYFSENFLNKYLGISSEITNSLNEEFDNLADEVLKQPQVLIHRDFQSQNIIIKNGDVRIVDFQGARFGPITYDLMSLIRDPYVKIPSATRRKLLKYYYRELNSRNIPEKMRMTENDFAKFAIITGLQRNMQALGAYAFLSLVKGKKRFLEYIPGGLKHLREGLQEFDSFKDWNFSLAKLKELIYGVSRPGI